MMDENQDVQKAIEKLLRGFCSKCIKNKKEYKVFAEGCQVTIKFGTYHFVSVQKIDSDKLIKDAELLKFLEENKSTIEGRMK